MNAIKSLNNKSGIFHVHTYRCGHAGTDSDQSYIERAIGLGASSITFTDHDPFPNDPFGNRMKFNQLNEYLESLRLLKDKFKECIDVRIGLEIEYLPSYDEYYKQLNYMGFDILMIGQHFYEHPDGLCYSFNDALNVRCANEEKGQIDAIISGIKTGLFNVIAHPDRSFRYCKEWTSKEDLLSKKLIDTALTYGVKLEENESSKVKGLFRPEFFDLVKKIDTKGSLIINGLDAHSVKELRAL